MKRNVEDRSANFKLHFLLNYLVLDDQVSCLSQDFTFFELKTSLRVISDISVAILLVGFNVP